MNPLDVIFDPGIKRCLTKAQIEIIGKALSLNTRERFATCTDFLNAFFVREV